jgi:pilus assembly protein CpaF
MSEKRTDPALISALGLLAGWYTNPEVHAIMVDGTERILVEMPDQEIVPLDTGLHFETPEALRAVIDAILDVAEVNVTSEQTVVDTRLPDGSRMLVVLPPTAVNGPSLVIVKLPEHRITWDMLLEFGSITDEARDLLKSAILARRNILISGGYNSGKTTFMNLVAELVPEDWRLVLLQTDFDLQVRHPRSVFLAAGEGTGPDLSDLIITASKMHPGWLVIGELIGAEAMRAMEVFSRGHQGATAIHANSPEDALTRLETMCLKANLGLGLSEIRAIIALALQVLVHQERLPNGKRSILQIVELRGLENGRYVLQPLFRYNFETERLEATETKPGW